MSDIPELLRLREAVRDWDERCDLDFRCPEAGRWPRTWDEFAQWAFKYGHDVCDFLRLQVFDTSKRSRMIEPQPNLRWREVSRHHARVVSILQKDLELRADMNGENYRRPRFERSMTEYTLAVLEAWPERSRVLRAIARLDYADMLAFLEEEGISIEGHERAGMDTIMKLCAMTALSAEHE